MDDFRTSLLREKFTINDLDSSASGENKSIIALSNRIIVPLVDKENKNSETFIVRTQNMHSCARMAAAILKEFFDNGTISNRKRPFYWDDLWKEVIKGYEKDFNPDIWCAVYHKGRPIFSEGENHQFLDIIEQCDVANEGEYNQSIKFAETAFKQAGKNVKIDYDSNVALVTAIDEEKAKCGVIIRSATGVTTFNYNVKEKTNANRPLHPHTILASAASFLEGVQLAFQVGLLNKKSELNLIERFSEEYKKAQRSEERLGNLNRAINSFEHYYNVHYRPDRPNFNKMVQDAESFAMKILEPQIKEMIDTGELDQNDWIV